MATTRSRSVAVLALLTDDRNALPVQHHEARVEGGGDPLVDLHSRYSKTIALVLAKAAAEALQPEGDEQPAASPGPDGAAQSPPATPDNESVAEACRNETQLAHGTNKMLTPPPRSSR